MGQYLIFFILALLAEILGTISGFGSSILFVPLAALVLDFKVVLGITAVFHVFSNLSKIFLFKKGLNLKIALRLGIPAVIFVSLGAWLTNFIPQKEIELGMNLIILAVAMYLLTGHQKSLKESNTNLFLGGTISGFLAGLIGTGGAIRGITLAAFKLEKDAFIATSAIIDMGVDLSRAGIYLASGYFREEHIILIPFLIIISVVGSYAGKRILQYISEKTFQYIVLGVILTTSMLQLIKYIFSK